MGQQSVTKMGFYYDQGFYYNQPDQGFYYDKNEEGFYYEQEKEGFYYDQEKGFYYEGFYYDGFYYNQPQGFYYDERDAGFNQGNKDYWYKGDGKKRMLAALNGIRTRVDDHILKNPIPPRVAHSPTLSPPTFAATSSKSLSPTSTPTSSSRTEAMTRNLLFCLSRRSRNILDHSTITERHGAKRDPTRRRPWMPSPTI